jgi:dTDP-4-dehydrorhamnose 3,5-epimerase-like enzyme
MRNSSEMQPTLIMGETHRDNRGEIRYFNSFKFENVVRMYQIEPMDTEIIRAWQGHKQERKYFFPIVGRFLVNLIFPDQWIEPSRCSKVESFQINSKKSQILDIPPGYINGFRALELNSSLIVFSSSTVTESTKDDYRWPVDYFSEAIWHQ